jgi:hypothetical protein
MNFDVVEKKNKRVNSLTFCSGGVFLFTVTVGSDVSKNHSPTAFAFEVFVVVILMMINFGIVAFVKLTSYSASAKITSLNTLFVVDHISTARWIIRPAVYVPTIE